MHSQQKFADKRDIKIAFPIKTILFNGRKICKNFIRVCDKIVEIAPIAMHFI